MYRRLIGEGVEMDILIINEEKDDIRPRRWALRRGRRQGLRQGRLRVMCQRGCDSQPAHGASEELHFSRFSSDLELSFLQLHPQD